MNRLQQRILQAALGYYDRSFCIIPIKYGDKKPEAEWKQYQKYRPSREQIKQWFSDGKNHNVGIVCGTVSGGLTVLVFNRGEDFEPFFEGDNILGMTPVAHSKRGAHAYLTSDEAIKSYIFGGGRFEVKGEGTYVVAPPSIHPSGVQYRWVNPEVVSQGIIVNIPDFWDWIKEKASRIGIDTNETMPGVTTGKLATIRTLERCRPKWVTEALSGPVHKSERNTTCFKLASYLLRHHLKSEVVRILTRWAKEKCEQPPDDVFEQKEVVATINSAYQFILERRS